MIIPLTFILFASAAFGLPRNSKVDPKRGPSMGPHHRGHWFWNHHDHHVPDTCIQTTLHDFKWQVKDLDYHGFWYFTTPAHANSWGYISFNLSNPAVDLTIPCSAQSSRQTDFFYGDEWFNCLVPDTAPADVSALSFRFSTHNRLDINETWVCDKQKSPVKFFATGTASLDLTCSDETWTNPNWTQGTGEFYSKRDVKCTPIDLRLKPFELKVAV